MEYILTRSSRKTIALYVRDGKVEVRAPQRIPKAQIDAFVSSKQHWIAKRLKQQAELAQKREAFQLHYGDNVRYRGKQYPIVARTGKSVGFDDAFYMPPHLTCEHIKAAVIQIYRKLAKDYFTERALHFQPQIGASITSLKITSAKTRWGSMSGKRSVNFSWRLIMAQDDLIDAVVVHELAHMKEMNHSKRFWALVESILPDWREREKRLKDFAHLISTENWDTTEQYNDN